MGCPKCGRGWGTIEGETLVCKCGYRETIKRADVLKKVTCPYCHGEGCDICAHRGYCYKPS